MKDPHKNIFPLRSDSRLKFKTFAGAICALCRNSANDSFHVYKKERICNECASKKGLK